MFNRPSKYTTGKFLPFYMNIIMQINCSVLNHSSDLVTVFAVFEKCEKSRECQWDN